MKRLREFARVAGWYGLLQTALFLVILFFALRADARSGKIVLTGPTVIAGFLLPKLFAHRMAQRVRLSAMIMNLFAAGGSLAYALGLLDRIPLPKNQVDLLCAAFGSVYLGCFFWLLSDTNKALVLDLTKSKPELRYR